MAAFLPWFGLVGFNRPADIAGGGSPVKQMGHTETTVSCKIEKYQDIQ